ncbi:excalibur calcium-binding domain-containing protein [Sphingomonas mesophila]|nr:excalibur calcium-binding domain-containing protein [Sphingomonas mesophila]
MRSRLLNEALITPIALQPERLELPPIHRGEPGYRDKLDGDSDGIACEPY